MQEPKNTPPAGFVVPPEGSLGLLALGYRGLKIWRARRKEARELMEKTGNISKNQQEHGKKDS
jgi:hypothetical protein